MTSGFAQAYARIVSQATQSDDETESLTSWDEYCQPVVPSDDDDNFEDDETCKKKGIKSNKHYQWETWSQAGADDPYLYQVSDVPEALWVLAGVEFGGKKANAVFVVKGAKRETKSKEFRTWHCAFYNCCGCERRYQVIYWKEENRWSIEIAKNTEHKHGLSKGGLVKQALLACVNSPSKLHNAPKSLIGVATTKTGQKLTQIQQKSLKRMISRRRVNHSIRDLQNGGDGSHYGDVVDSLLSRYHRSNIGGFNRDSVYLLGDEVCVEEVTDKKGVKSTRFYCVLSTENLLLNGPRQKSTGQSMMLAVDGSYRYVTEKDHGLFVVKTLNHSQSARTIAYAICNREDQVALEWIFTAIKEETERIVNGLMENGIKYM